MAIPTSMVTGIGLLLLLLRLLMLLFSSCRTAAAAVRRSKQARCGNSISTAKY